jgi:hypothetical protein
MGDESAMIWSLLVLAILVILVITNRVAGKTYVGKALLAMDYFVSVLWSRDFDITISSQCGLYWKKGNPPAFWFVLHKALNALQKDHCELAMAGDLARGQAAVKLLS